MGMAIDSDRATEKGVKTTNKVNLSISIDPALRRDFVKYCKSHKLKYAPIVEDLIAQYLEERKKKK